MPACDNNNLGWIGIGTFLYMWDTSQSPAAWVKISKIDNHDGPNITTDKVEATTHDTTTGFKDYLPNLSDGGQLNEAMVWDPTDATHAGSAYTSLRKATSDKLTRKWKLVYPTSPKWGQVFCGFIDGYKVMAPVKDLLRAQVSIKIVGEPDLTTTLT